MTGQTHVRSQDRLYHHLVFQHLPSARPIASASCPANQDNQNVSLVVLPQTESLLLELETVRENQRMSMRIYLGLEFLCFHRNSGRERVAVTVTVRQ